MVQPTSSSPSYEKVSVHAERELDATGADAKNNCAVYSQRFFTSNCSKADALAPLDLCGSAPREHLHEKALKQAGMNVSQAIASVQAAPQHVTKQGVDKPLPPQIIGLIGAHFSRDEYTEKAGPLLQQLGVDTSTATRKLADQARNNASDAIKQAVKNITANQKLSIDPRLKEKLSDVHHIEGLHLYEANEGQLKEILLFLVQYCPNLRSLDFTNSTNLSLNIISLLPQFTHLHTLRVNDSNITDEMVAQLQGLNLEECDLSCTRIHGSTLNQLPPGIKKLSLQGCRNLTDANVAKLAHLLQLEECDLSWTQIHGSTLNKLPPGIKKFLLEYCYSLTNANVAKLAHLQQLEKCDLSNTPIDGSTLDQLPPGIKNLVLQGCRYLTDDANVAKLAHLPQLEECDLSWTQIDGSTLDKLPPGIKKLLLLSCTNLTDANVAKLTHLQQLEECSLNGNPQLSQATQMQYRKPKLVDTSA